MNIVICADFPFANECADALRPFMSHATISTRDRDLREVTRNAVPADYALVWMPPPELFVEHSKLRAIFTLGAGVDALLKQSTLPSQVPLIRLEDAGMAQPMAEYVLIAALRARWRMGAYAKHQRAHRWQRETVAAREQSPVGVLGLGAIGAHIARTLVAHGFAVRGFSRSAKSIDGVETFAGQARAGDPGFDRFIDGLALVVNVLPSTPETAHVLGRAAFAQMADGAHVVNVGRGAAIDDHALVEAIDAGKLAGATLDVFQTEPLPSDHPFWSRPEIEITPHISGVTPVEPAMKQIAEKIARLERGSPVSGVVDRARGY